VCFFFQAEDGIRDWSVTGVQTCALPIFTTDQDAATRGRYLKVGTPTALPLRLEMQDQLNKGFAPPSLIGAWDIFPMLTSGAAGRSEERRVGKEWRWRGGGEQWRKRREQD